MATAKERNKDKLLEYLTNPENEFRNRTFLATEVLGYKKRQSLTNCFTSAELDQIEAEALEIRRSKYSSDLAKIDASLLKAAKGGDTAAIKLAYQKFEGWKEVTRKELTGKNGEPVEVNNTRTIQCTNALLERIAPIRSKIALPEPGED